MSRAKNLDPMQRIQRPVLLATDRSVTLLDLREHAARARSNGFDGVEWSLPDCFEQLQPAISHLGAIPIRAVAMRCEMMDIPSAAPFVISRLQTGSLLGANVINLSIPPVRIGSDGEGFAHYQDALDFAYGLLQRVRFEAEAAGVSIALEAASGGCLASPLEVRELIDAVNSSAIGVCLDVERIRAIGSPLDWIDTLHCRVQSVRLTDGAWSGGNAADQTSQVPIDTSIQALHGVPPECPLILSRNASEGGLPTSGAMVRVWRAGVQSGTDEHH